MNLRELLFGRPLRTEEQEEQTIGPLRGVPILGLDALASASYGPEAALTILMAFGAAATRFIGPISAVIVALLIVLYVSYRQTIAAYPGGGGAYTVASENLGRRPALLAASALFLDYVLNVAVAISAGVGAIVSAAPKLLPYTLPLCLAILVFLTIVNLRGVREAGLVFMVPTYAFVLTLGGIIVVGIARSIAAGGHPAPVVPPPAPQPAVASTAAGAATVWLLLHAFASGCTAMTGVEAVSNGVPLFRKPVVREAHRTLTAIIAALVLLLAGIAFLSRAYGITATPPGATGYQSIVSQLVAAVTGRSPLYYVTMAAVVAVLCLSANTSFADFPRLCRVLALDGFLPAEFAHPGRRLVYSAGIVALSLIAAALLVIFGGITDRLIPLFAVGAFLTFTLSQAGMTVHWKRHGGRGATHARFLNAAGTVATGTTLVVVVVAKFTEGAWITVLVVPALVAFFASVKRHELWIAHRTELTGPLEVGPHPPPIVVVPVKRLDRVARKALQIATGMSPHVQVVQVFAQELSMEDLRREWHTTVERPLEGKGISPPELVLLPSPYRDFYAPLLEHVHALVAANPERYVAVVVPELVERKWYYSIIRSHRPVLLQWLLQARGGPHVVVVVVPWYLDANAEEDGGAPSGGAR